MRWMKLSRIELTRVLNKATATHLQAIIGYSKKFISITKYPEPKKTKGDILNLLPKLLLDEEYKRDFYHKLCSTAESKELYHLLVWKQKSLSIEEVKNQFNIDLDNTKRAPYEYGVNRLNGVLELIYMTDNWNKKEIFINEKIRPILKLIHPIPDDFDLKAVEKLEETQYTYNNEEGVLNVIATLEDMVKTKLIVFGKTGEKPLAKSLNILKSTTVFNEFYSTKKMDAFSIDM
ncbi:MAG: hypothetical protein DRG78_08860, partial [Epsilonproteobacteria bacterium]